VHAVVRRPEHARIPLSAACPQAPPRARMDWPLQVADTHIGPWADLDPSPDHLVLSVTRCALLLVSTPSHTPFLRAHVSGINGIGRGVCSLSDFPRPRAACMPPRIPTQWIPIQPPDTHTHQSKSSINRSLGRVRPAADADRACREADRLRYGQDVHWAACAVGCACRGTKDGQSVVWHALQARGHCKNADRGHSALKRVGEAVD
jgi:hypothetical protein